MNPYKKTAAVCGMAALTFLAQPRLAQAGQGGPEKQVVKHVLLISIDGMHALDFANCAKGIDSINGGQSFCPNLAELKESGINFLAASTTKPSDSFPGSVAYATGALPRTAGVFYDVSYDRALYPPASSGTPCSGATGTVVAYDESADYDLTKLDGGGGINPANLPRDKNCNPVYPHSFVRVNTIFEVIKANGGYTAWSDKHPAYDIYNGPSGKGVDDLYTPEINSNVVPVPGCTPLPDTSPSVTAWTTSFKDIQCYDALKVEAIVREIHRRKSDGSWVGKTPTIFGMNFQAVSVGQKLVQSGVRGGYLDSIGTPTAPLLDEIEFVDRSIGRFVRALKEEGIFGETLIIVTAKHGQSPIDYNRLLRIPADDASKMAPSDAVDGALGKGTVAGSSEDDISLLWLSDQSKTADAVKALETNETTIGAGEIFSGESLKLLYNDPATDSRTPDIAVAPNVGVVYTGGKKKVSEHGGFAHDDVNVILLVSNPNLVAKVVAGSVETKQIAPTILSVLGIEPRNLDGVRKEGTLPLPGVVSHLAPRD